MGAPRIDGEVDSAQDVLGTEIGFDREKDLAAKYHVDKSGIVAVGRGRSKWAHLKR